MAEAFLKSFDTSLTVCSAGTEPVAETNPYAIEIMNEAGIDISTAKPKNIDLFSPDDFDYNITMCEIINPQCPLFGKTIDNSFHIGFDNLLEFEGEKTEKIMAFRKLREEIKKQMLRFYKRHLQNINN